MKKQSIASVISEIRQLLDDRYKEDVRLSERKQENYKRILGLKETLAIAHQMMLDNFFELLGKDSSYSVEVYEQVDEYLEHHEFMFEATDERFLNPQQERDAWNYFWSYQEEYASDTD